jgi:diguanylate cyclase (GGDEF)-like protein
MGSDTAFFGPLVQEARDSRERLEIMAHLLKGWFWEMDDKLRFRYFTDTVQEFAGKPPEWHYGKTRQEVGTIDPLSPQFRRHMAQLEQRIPFDPLEFPRTEGDRTIWMRTTGAPYFDEDGRFRGYRGVAFEVTAERQAKEAEEIALARLRLSERRLADKNGHLIAALSSMRQALVIFDRSGALLVWNRQFIDLFNLAPGIVREGLSHHALLAHLREAGAITDSFSEALISPDSSGNYELSPGAQNSTVEQLSDGRTVSVYRANLSGGGWIATYEDVTERQETERTLRKLATTDTLTGLGNRASFDAALRTQVSDPTSSIALHVIDLDRFKSVNDNYGHQIGDRLLEIVGKRIKGAIRDRDVATRLGGDEFAVIQRTDSEASALGTANRIIASLSRPYRIFDYTLVIGASIGTAMFPGDGKTADELLKNADLALYSAKHDGRGTCRRFDSKRHCVPAGV